MCGVHTAVTVLSTYGCHCVEYMRLSLCGVQSYGCHCVEYIRLSRGWVHEAVTVWSTYGCHCVEYIQLSLCGVHLRLSLCESECFGMFPRVVCRTLATCYRVSSGILIKVMYEYTCTARPSTMFALIIIIIIIYCNISRLGGNTGQYYERLAYALPHSSHHGLSTNSVNRMHEWSWFVFSQNNYSSCYD